MARLPLSAEGRSASLAELSAMALGIGIVTGLAGVLFRAIVAGVHNFFFLVGRRVLRGRLLEKFTKQKQCRAEERGIDRRHAGLRSHCPGLAGTQTALNRLDLRPAPSFFLVNACRRRLTRPKE